jgi:hypothetical protein
MAKAISIAEAQRLAERKRVDEFMQMAQQQRAALRAEAAAKAPPPTAQQVAMGRNDQRLKQYAPSGFLRLLQALGLR